MPREHNAQGQFIQAESIVRPIGNEAEAKAKRQIKNEAETEVSGNNMAENPVKENPGENPVRMTSEATIPEE